jgi:hypothetical protein
MARQILSLVSALFRYMTRKASSALVISNDAISSSNRLRSSSKGSDFPEIRRHSDKREEGGEEKTGSPKKHETRGGKKTEEILKMDRRVGRSNLFDHRSIRCEEKKCRATMFPARLPLSLQFTTVVTTSFSFVAVGNDDMDG